MPHLSGEYDNAIDPGQPPGHGRHPPSEKPDIEPHFPAFLFIIPFQPIQTSNNGYTHKNLSEPPDQAIRAEKILKIILIINKRREIILIDNDCQYYF